MSRIDLQALETLSRVSLVPEGRQAVDTLFRNG